MKMTKSYFRILLFCLSIFFFTDLVAQIPSDLSKIRSSQITDAQLMQFVQQAQSSGMSEADLLAEFQRRGLPDTEIQALAARVKGLTGNVTDKVTSAADPVPVTKRQFKGESTPVVKANKPSKVFGSELFTSADPLFVPNLKIATPKNYVIGTDDELQLDIYGNNISSQKLTVSPEGIINVKYAGPVNVSGMTIEQATGVLKSRLTKFYPSISSGETRLQLALGSIRSIQVMVIGAVKNPGTITLPSIATLFNALYASGGPAENGSYRNIELVRGNKLVNTADLYDFMLRGDQSSNLPLRDNDVIRVPFAQVQVSLEGALNRTGIFEFKSNEFLEQALYFAGGFKSNAFKGRITGYRFTDVQRTVIDIPKEDFSRFILKNGDSLTINTVVDKFENRVTINGAVSKPGVYALEDGLDISKLVAKAEGLSEGAFAGRATLVRLNEDLSKEFVDIDLRKHLKGEEKLLLKKEDVLNIFLEKELKEIRTVAISGAVKNGGSFEYEDSLTLQGLILKAGGFLENALGSSIEIGRRKKVVDPSSGDGKIADILIVKIDKNLEKIGEDIYLQPYDIVSVRLDPGTIPQKKVSITGKVLLPGDYTMQTNADLLTDLVNRAGGLLPIADVEAVKLLRRNRSISAEEVKRVAEANVKSDSTAVDDEEIVKLSSTQTEVAINLKKALASPGSKDDISLEEGDQLVVPQVNYVVTISGEVQKPLSVQFESGLSLRQYINQTGGFSVSADRSKSFVVYPNGRSSVIRRPLGIFQITPQVTPGSTIFVPKKIKKDSQFDPAKAGILVSAFSAVMTGLVLLFR
jgi:protein involved in polysaccharide export with SLBB domain